MTVPHIFNTTPVSCSDVNLCSYSTWSSYFPRNIPPAKVLRPLPQAFLDYLDAESIRLPPTSDRVQANSDNEYSDWEEESDNEDPTTEFAELDAQLRSIVSEWKSVAVKLNWTAPKDARWILINNTMECTSVSDIYLLLNAADHAAHDLNQHMYDECHDKDSGPHLEPELVVKKWLPNYNPALEFRVFVRDGEILGVCQRNMDEYLFLEGLRPKIHSLLRLFWDNVVRSSGYPLRSFIMDVYLPPPYEEVTIIDINPFTRKWDPLLFTWHELLEMDPTGDFKVRLFSETEISRRPTKQHSENQVPIEVVDALLDSAAMVELARNWDALGRAN